MRRTKPGRILTETTERGAITTFRVDPERGGSCVTIETHWETARVQRLMQRLVAPRLLQPIYVNELEGLDGYSRGTAGRLTTSRRR